MEKLEAFFGLDANILILLSIVLFLFIVVVILLLILLSKKRKKNLTDDKIRIIDGKRYSTLKNPLTTSNEVNITHLEKDIILERGKNYKVVKNGFIMPGKYTILSGDENTKVFNMRLNGFVREYKHNTDIVVAEGDEISSVSHTTIIR